MAQSVEHFVHIEGVVGSSPTVTTQKSGRRYESTLAGFFCVPFCVPLRVRTRGTQRVRKNRCVPVRKWGTQMPKKCVPLRASRSHQPFSSELSRIRPETGHVPFVDQVPPFPRPTCFSRGQGQRVAKRGQSFFTLPQK